MLLLFCWAATTAASLEAVLAPPNELPNWAATAEATDVPPTPLAPDPELVTDVPVPPDDVPYLRGDVPDDDEGVWCCWSGVVVMVVQNGLAVGLVIRSIIHSFTGVVMGSVVVSNNGGDVMMMVLRVLNQICVRVAYIER